MNDEQQRALWGRISDSLRQFKDAAVPVTGETKQPTGQPPMKMAGHQQLHRETNIIRECRRETFLVVGRRPADLTRIAELRSRLRHDLLRSTMTVPPVLLDVTKAGLLDETEALLKEQVSRIDSETLEKQSANFKVLAALLQGSFNAGGAKTMQRVTGKLSTNHGMWGVDTDYPDTLWISIKGADSDSLRALVERGTASRLAGPDGVAFRVNRLRDMYDLLVTGHAAFPDNVSLRCDARRIVTSACDKLCAQERFLGDNAMSKQARCTECGCGVLQTVSRVSYEGSRTWGAVCSLGHWSRTDNPLRDFTGDTYGEDTYRDRCIPPDARIRIRGSVRRQDFDWLVQNLPSWKSPGDDLIPNELLKGAPTWILDELYAAVNQVMMGGKLPAEWKFAIIKLLEKKAPASSMSNQRPVCCARTVYKLVSYFVTSRMTRMLKHYGVTENVQEGFRSQRSCQRQASRYVDILDDARRNKKRLYSLYIDWGNAFNSIDQDVLWRAMRLAGFNQSDVEIVSELYRDSSFAVENPFGTTAALPCKCWVKQGDVVSPALFSLAMNILLLQLAKRGGGYFHSSGEHTNDDAGKLQGLVDEFKRFADWSGMWVNVTKSMISAYDFASKSELKTSHIKYGGKRFAYLAADKPYKYLGFHISLTLDWTYHKQAVRSKITETIDHLRDTIYQYGQVESM
eukprot:3938899-Rhodomonas_salina.1